MMGVYSANESVAISRSRDKLRSLQLLARRDIGLPVTGFAHTADDIPDLINMVGGAPLVVKLLEVNSSPGLEGIENASGVDVASLVIEFIERNARRGKTRTRGSG